VGTNLVTGSPEGALDGVYKLSESNGKPRLKISESLSKVTIPHKKQVYRLSNPGGELVGADAVTLRDETEIGRIHDPREALKSLKVDGLAMEPLLHPVMINGEKQEKTRSLEEISEYAKKRLGNLPFEYKRFYNPHIYKVGISSKLKKEREELMLKYKM
jgi:nicotinate phosphoribosyltransferase